jgi:predicted glycoside hydrolase/deacetylase ChbG (UPF0249 family)
MKRAAVTGPNSVLGQSFCKLLTQRGYQVHTFSRSSGFDLRDYSAVSKMLEHVTGFDVFVNLAKPDYAQAQILYRLAREWTTGTVINIGSSAVNSFPGWSDTYLLEYLTQKIALQHAFEMLCPQSKCHLIMLHPEHLDNTDDYVESVLTGHDL